jgi:CheY-like chemotaxis protein
MRVLVVDDNGANRRILEEVLAQWGLKPTTAADGRAAVAILDQADSQGEPFHLVLLDREMPEWDGFAVAERMQQRPQPNGAIIMMLSSASSLGDRARCRELGIAECCLKPIKQSDLYHALLKAVGAAERAARSPPARSPPHEHPRRRLRILLAEDNPVNQTLALRLLEKQGQTVVLANNGRAALEALSRDAYDLVLMDVQMPEMDGLQAVVAIREREKQTGAHLPVIAMTAYAMKGDRERCLAAGMDGYVAKPLNTAELWSAIAAVMEPSHPRREVAEETTAAVVPGAGDHDIDLPHALRQCGDHSDLFWELANLFLHECPKWMEQIQTAIARQDPQGLCLAAHTLKGGVSHFSAKKAFDAALAMETLGRSGDFSKAEPAWTQLVQEIDRLKEAIQSLRPDSQAPR